MDRKFAATYEYTEVVRGEERTFVHETFFDAPTEDTAYQAALKHFGTIAVASGVGWTRTLKSCAVRPVPAGARARGGRRIAPGVAPED